MRPGPGAPDRYHELSERDVRQRELSQNLLRGRAAAEEFLDRVDLGPDDLCVEVGAGDGVITEPLAGCVARWLPTSWMIVWPSG